MIKRNVRINETGYGFKALDPTGATYPDRRDGSGEMLYALPRPDEKWGPWMIHPRPARWDGEACGSGRYHVHLRLSGEYGPLNWWPWFVEWRDPVGGDGIKVGVLSLRLRRISPRVLWRCLRLGWGSFANLRGANLRDADLTGANLRDADLRNANLRNADLRGADLYDADLYDADLYGAYLTGADLRDADLRNADLRDADLRGANLRDADLRDADLRNADLRDADLRGANLRDADLTDANLCGANLTDADLCGANLRSANLYDADLTNVKGAFVDD